MKLNQSLVFLGVIVAGIISQGVEAKEPQTLRNARYLVQNPTEAVVVTGVELNSTDQGLEIILETANQDSLQPIIFPEDQTLVIEILGAVLQLPQESDFRADNPTPEISNITIEQLEDNIIQIRVKGKNQVPGAEVLPSLENLVLILTPTLETATPETEIEIVATEDQEDNYYVPRTTTATGTDTPLIDIPQSVQIVPEKIIRQRNTRELQPALQIVPGVSPASGRGTSVNGPGILIRGFDATEILRDGIPYFSLAPINTSDIERIEVLKGPASVLFGEGEPGGTINLIAKKPLEEDFYEVSFTAGNFNTYLTNIDLSGPLNEEKTVKYRLILSYDSYGSFRDFVDGEMLLVSPSLTWEITPKTTINFYAQYLNTEETIDEGIPAFGDGVVDVPRDRFLGEDFGELNQEQFVVGYKFNHDFNENLSVRHAFEYFRYDPTRFAPLFNDFNETTGELERIEYFADGLYERLFVNAEVVGKFKTGPINHQVLAGVEYRRNTEDPSFQFDNLYTSINVFDPRYTRRPYPIDPQFFRDDEVDRVGVYIQDQIDLLSNLKLLAGVRYDYVDQFRTTRNAGEPRQEFNQTDDRFSPRVGIVYQPIPAVALYGSYSTSFNPSFGTIRNPDDSNFDPEIGRQFEVGVKADVSNRFSITLAAFDIRKENIQVPDPDDPLFTRQSGEQTSRGIELYAVGEILPGWNLVAGYTYLDAFVNKDTTEIEGNILTNVPTNEFSLWTTYEIQQGSLNGLGFGLGLFYIGERQGDLENTFTLPSYFRTDAALFYDRDRWSVQLNVENLFDVEYFAGADSRLRVDPGAPFTIRGRVSFRF